MEKKFVGVRMYPCDAHKLKIWAAEADKPIGDLIHDIINLVEQGKVEVVENA